MNAPLYLQFASTFEELLDGAYAVDAAIHMMFNVSRVEACDALAGAVHTFAMKRGTSLRACFEEEVGLFMQRLYDTYFNGKPPAWYDRGVEVFLYTTIQKVLGLEDVLATHGKHRVLKDACVILCRIVSAFRDSLVTKTECGSVAMMLVMESVRSSVVYPEEGGERLSIPWAVLTETLAQQICSDNSSYTGGPVSKTSSLGHACCSTPMRILFQKVAMNRELLSEVESTRCAQLSRMLSSLTRNACAASARIKIGCAPNQSHDRIDWGKMSRHMLKQGVLKKTRQEREHWRERALHGRDSGLYHELTEPARLRLNAQCR